MSLEEKIEELETPVSRLHAIRENEVSLYRSHEKLALKRTKGKEREVAANDYEKKEGPQNLRGTDRRQQPRSSTLQ